MTMVARPMAVAPWPRRAVAAVLWSGVVAVVPRSVAAVPRSRGRATAGPLCGHAAASSGPWGGGTSKADEQAAPLDVRVATATHEARGSSERRHGRREVCAAMIVRDILRSGAVWAARVTTYICACVIDDILWPLPPLIRVFIDYCVLCLPHVLCMLKTIRFYAWARSSYISLLHAYFLYAHWKDNFLIYVVHNYHKKSNHLYS
jgi:hypothetical protein